MSHAEHSEDAHDAAEAPGAWHVDRRVPIAVILTMLLQFGGIVFWTATLSGSVTSQGERIARLEADRTAAGVSLGTMQQSLARIDERTGLLIERLRGPLK